MLGGEKAVQGGNPRVPPSVLIPAHSTHVSCVRASVKLLMICTGDPESECVASLINTLVGNTREDAQIFRFSGLP